MTTRDELMMLAGTAASCREYMEALDMTNQQSDPEKRLNLDIARRKASKAWEAAEAAYQAALNAYVEA